MAVASQRLCRPTECLRTERRLKRRGTPCFMGFAMVATDFLPVVASTILYLPIRLVQGSVDLRAVDELAVCDGWPGSGAPEQEVGQVGDVPAAIEAVVPLARIARQVLGADAVEGAVEPRLHVAEQDMDDGQHGIGVFPAALDDRVVAEAVGEAVVALQTIGDEAGTGFGIAADKAAQIRRGSGRQYGDAGAAGDETALLDALALARRGRDCFDRDRHQALVRIAEAAAPAFGFAATTVIALIDLDQTVEWIFPPLA